MSCDLSIKLKNNFNLTDCDLPILKLSKQVQPTVVFEVAFIMVSHEVPELEYEHAVTVNLRKHWNRLFCTNSIVTMRQFPNVAFGFLQILRSYQ